MPQRSRSGAPRRKLDPDALLFNTQTGTLTDRSKALSREGRKRQAILGLPTDETVDEWVKKVFSFSLRSLKEPDEEEKAILSAISRSAREIMPEPGAKIRAVPLERAEFLRGDVDLAPGYLPLEPPAKAISSGRPPALKETRIGGDGPKKASSRDSGRIAVAEYQIPWPQYFQNNRDLSRPWGVRGIPTVFVIDQTGRIVTKRGNLDAILSKLLKDVPTADATRSTTRSKGKGGQRQPGGKRR